jgi:hypothetical protein
MDSPIFVLREITRDTTEHRIMGEPRPVVTAGPFMAFGTLYLPDGTEMDVRTPLTLAEQAMLSGTWDAILVRIIGKVGQAQAA